MNKQRIIIYDGICNLCNFWINFIIKKDKKKLFLSLSSTSLESKVVIKKYKLETLVSDTIILIKDEKTYIKSEAILEVFKDLGSIFYIFTIFKILPLSFRNYLYTLLAKNRYKIFGKQKSC